MADTWGRYFGGIQLTPGEILAERERRAEADAAVRASAASPEQRMAFLESQSALGPIPTHHPGEVWSDAGNAARYAGGAVLNAFDTLGRGRDAAFRAAQEVNRPLIGLVEGRNGTVRSEGNWNPMAALGHLASIPSNMAAPLTGSRVVGGYQEPDDWRQYATPGNAMAIEMVTDPGNWLPLPSVNAVKSGLRSASGAANALRYGRGIKVLDNHGNAVRQLVGAR
jgi:hypothetical protein